MTKMTNEITVQVTAPAKVKTPVSSNRRVGHFNDDNATQCYGFTVPKCGSFFNPFFDKPTLPIKNQIQLLRKRGSVIANFATTASDGKTYHYEY